MRYQNHIEISEGDTKLVSTVFCPLLRNEIENNQLFEDNEGEDTVMCIIEGQRLKDGTFNTFCCPYFYGAIYPFKSSMVNCKHPKFKENVKK